MRTKLLGLSMVMAVFGSTALGGCGSDDADPNEGTPDSGASSSGSSSGRPNPSSSSGEPDAGPQVNNDSFETAALLATGEGGSLTPSDDADSDGFLAGSIEPGKARYYYIELDEASAGYPMVFLANARETDSDDSKHDLYVSLYNEDRQQIAANDDALYGYGTFRNPLLRTVIPAAGRYYLKVEPFCELAEAECAAGWDSAVTDPSFVVGTGFMNADAYGVDNDTTADANGTPATAVPVALAPLSSSGTVLAYDGGLFGSSSSATDLDYYKVNIPSDLPLEANHRVSLNVVFPLAGSKGTGASSTASVAWLVDSADPGNKLASFDVKGALALENAATFGAEASIPLQKNHDYYVVVQNADAAAGNYYFASATALSGNPVESDAAGANDTAATAQALTVADTTSSYFVEGDLATGDVDYFKVAVVSGKTKIAVSCGAQSSGSGVRGLKATILNGATEVSNAVENATSGLSLSDVDVPSGATELLVKLEPSQAQAAGITGAFYRCGIHFQ